MKKYSEVISGVVLFALAAVYFWMALSIKQFNAGQPGIVTSDVMPKIYSVGVMILSAILTIRGVFDLKKGNRPGAEEERECVVNAKWNLPVQPEILATFLLLVLYVAFLRSVGFVIMSILFAIGISHILLPREKRSRKTYLIILAVSVVFTVVITLIFVRGFNLTIPMGVFS